MASFAPIAKTIPVYRDFKNQFLKAFIPGSTTTPKLMATDATGATTVSKFELDKDGFPKTSGGALVIPYISGRYDLWLFPTAAEADANDTVNAKRFAINVEATDTGAVIDRLNPDTLAIWQADTSAEVDDVVKTKERSTGDGGGATGDVISGTGTANGFNIVAHDTLSLSFVLRTGMIINPAQWGVNGTTDSLIIQAIYDFVSDYTVIEASGLTIDMDTLVNHPNTEHITTQNGNWHWNHQSTNMIKLSGTLNKSWFRGMKCFGNSDAFTSQGCIGCPSGTITNDWTIQDCVFEDMPFGVFVNADLSGAHTNCKVSGNTFRNMVRDTVADASGIGNGLVFSGFAGNLRGCVSSNNSFEICGRHSLYITSGGNVTSIGDSFDKHRNDGSALVTTGLAALFVARNSQDVTIIGPRFSRCSDIALSIQGVQHLAAQTFGNSVNVISPTFEDNLAGDFEIGNDSPTVNGWISNIKITDIQINQKGNSNAPRGLILSGLNITIDGLMLEANQNVGATELVDIIRIEDTASTVSQFNNITIKNLKGTDTGSSSRGVHVDAGLLDGTLDVNLRLEDIDVGTSSLIFESSTVPINPNYLKLSRGKPVLFSAFTGSFTNKASEINTVDKYAGKKIFSLSGGLVKPLYATGSTDVSTWVDGVGTVVHTPV